MNSVEKLAARSLNAQFLSRRFFLQDVALGLGGVALSTILQSSGLGKGSATREVQPDPRKMFPQFAAKAKHVIFMFMAGGPSQLDLFDPKPTLVKYEGQEVPDEILKGADLPFI